MMREYNGVGLGADADAVFKFVSDGINVHDIYELSARFEIYIENLDLHPEVVSRLRSNISWSVAIAAHNDGTEPDMFADGLVIGMDIESEKRDVASIIYFNSIGLGCLFSKVEDTEQSKDNYTLQDVEKIHTGYCGEDVIFGGGSILWRQH